MLLNSDIFFTSLFLFSFLFFSLVSLNFCLLFLFFSVDQLLHISLFVFYCQSLSVFFSWNSKRLGCWICYITEKVKQREIPSYDCIFILYQIQIILAYNKYHQPGYCLSQLLASNNFPCPNSSVFYLDPSTPTVSNAHFLFAESPVKSGNVFPSQRLCF